MKFENLKVNLKKDQASRISWKKIELTAKKVLIESIAL